MARQSYTEKENYSPNTWGKRPSYKQDKTPNREPQMRGRNDTYPKPIPRDTYPNWSQSAPDSLENEDWIPGAIKCKERKHSRFEGNMKIQSIKRIFTMMDGSIEVVEDRLIEKIS